MIMVESTFRKQLREMIEAKIEELKDEIAIWSESGKPQKQDQIAAYEGEIRGLRRVLELMDRLNHKE